MSTTTIRVSERTHQHLSELSSMSGRSMQEIAAEAIEAYRRQQLFAQANQDYANLLADPEAMAAWNAEEAMWDSTLNDALEEY